jgi:flagellar hook-basal body complex protein FliE
MTADLTFLLISPYKSIMEIKVLSSDDIAARLRDLTTRAAALQARIQGATTTADGPGSIGRLGGLSDGAASVSQPTLDFQSVLKDAIRGVSDAQTMAQSKAQAYQLGDDRVSLEEVMISMQRASLAMQGMVQVRNRLVEAYREVMNMQV